MSAPGELRERLVLEEPVEMPDGAGGSARAYAATATVWAALTPASARGGLDAEAQGVTVSHRIVIRTRADVTTRHRFRLGARVFRVTAIHELPGRYLDIAAEERTD